MSFATKAVGGLFGGADMPAVAPPPPAPTPDNKAAELDAAARDERMRRAAAGRASTNLTGGQGLLNEPAPTASKKLLGS